MKNIAIVFVVIAVLAVAFTASVFPQKKESAPLGRTFIQEKMMEVERGLQPHLRGNYNEQLFQNEQLKQNQRLKIGEREIPLQTPDGTSPTEHQIAAIKNVLTEDFLVNDDTSGGTARPYDPYISMDGSGNFVIVWQDFRYGLYNPDIIGQRYYANGTARGANYRLVADGPNHGEQSPVVVANASQIVFSRMDNRRSKGWDIYAKIVGWDWNGENSVLSEKNIPTEFALLQNYPNPFNPQTMILFSVPKESYVTLKVYDLLSREVAKLIQEKKQHGEYTITWSAEGVTSGVYFCRLVAGDYFETKKMVVMK